MIWVRDFGSTKVSESPEYFVYCELFEMNCWSKRSTLIAKGEFLEVPNNLSHKQTKTAACCSGLLLFTKYILYICRHFGCRDFQHDGKLRAEDALCVPHEILVAQMEPSSLRLQLLLMPVQRVHHA